MSEKKPIRVGIVGIGRAGWGMHSKTLEGKQDMFTIVAACDPCEDRTAMMAEKWNCKTYQDVSDLIKDPEVELVDIASRSPMHVPQAVEALKAGKSVFLEKPIALSYEEARTLAPAAKASKGNLYIRHNRRFEPAFQHIREIMADGILGDVYEIKLRRLGYQRRDDWQTIIECGGGQLLNWGPHIIDHGLRLLESPLAELWSDLKLIAAVGDAEDHLKIIMKGENGRLVDLEISGGAALKEPEYIIFGTRGALTCDGSSIHLRYLDPEQVLEDIEAKRENPPIQGPFGRKEDLVWIDETIPVAPKANCQTEDVWNHLYANMRENTPYPITLEEALQVMDVISKVKAGTRFQG